MSYGPRTCPSGSEGATDSLALDLAAIYTAMGDDAMSLVNQAVGEGWTSTKLIRAIEGLLTGGYPYIVNHGLAK